MSQLRRTFIGRVAGGALLGAARSASTADPAKALPTVRFGDATITQLIIVGNPLGGYSDSRRKLDDIMRHRFTVERIADLLMHAEEQGINTFQSHYAPMVAARRNSSRKLSR